MRLRLDVGGITMSLHIMNYKRQPQAVDDDEGWRLYWCEVDYSFVAAPWLNYCRKENGVFLSSEVDELTQALEVLAAGKLKKPLLMRFAEPDFAL